MNTNPLAGFTLVETLVSVLLLTMTIVLPYYAIQRSLSATFSARDDLIASALAQEALEYVRGVRDNNYLAGRVGTNWLYGLDGGAGEWNCFTSYCTIDATKGTNVNEAVAPCPGGTPICNNKQLFLSATNPHYTQDEVGTRTMYTRYIQLSSVAGNSNAVRITATVTWVARGTHSIVLTDILTNWI